VKSTVPDGVNQLLYLMRDFDVVMQDTVVVALSTMHKSAAAVAELDTAFYLQT